MKVNKEIRDILAQNIGNGVHIAFKGVDEDGSVPGVIRAVTDDLVKLEWKNRKENGDVDTVITYVDMSEIRHMIFDDPSAFDSDGFWIDDDSDEDTDAQQGKSSVRGKPRR